MLRRQEQHAVPAAVGSAGNVHREHCAVPGPSGILVCSGLEQAQSVLKSMAGPPLSLGDFSSAVTAAAPTVPVAGDKELTTSSELSRHSPWGYTGRVKGGVGKGKQQ